MHVGKESERRYEPITVTLAREILNSPVPTIIGKERLAPSGDPHDYISVSHYAHSASNGGVVIKDGVTSPNKNYYKDPELLSQMKFEVNVLYYADEFAFDQKTKDECSTRLTDTLKTWFVNPETRMNPNLKYAQMDKPDDTKGKPWGIIDGVGLEDVAVIIKNLHSVGKLTEEDFKGMKEWFSDYLKWLQESNFGKIIKGRPNNMGTFYDVQVAYIAELLDDEELIAEAMDSAKKRITSQIEPNGKMPEEAKRANTENPEAIDVSLDYELFNLQAFTELAVLGKRHGHDLWNYVSTNGGSILGAFSYFNKHLASRIEPYRLPFVLDRIGTMYRVYYSIEKEFGIKCKDIPDLIFPLEKTALARELSPLAFG